VFSPRSTAARLAAEQRRLTGGLLDDDAVTHPLSLPDGPEGAWQLIEGLKSRRVAASSLWIDGQPAQLGLGARARQAWRSVFGARLQPVLVVVTADTNAAVPASVGHQPPAARIVAFLQAQPALTDLIHRLAGVTD
jgi:hypothetical protein